MSSIFGGMFRRWLKENPPFYPSFNSFFLNRDNPIYIDTDDLMCVYLSIPHLRLVIDQKAKMFANMEIKLVDKDGKEKDQHPVLTLLKNPNPLQTQEQFLAQYSIYKDIYANAFIYKLKAFKDSLPKVLWNLPGGDMKVIPTGKMFQQMKIEDIVKHYEFTVDNGLEPTKFKTDEIIHISTGVSENYFIGKSAILTLNKALSNIDGAYKTRNILIHEKGAIGILSSETKDSDGAIPFGPGERQRIEREYHQKYGLGDDKMRIIMSGAALKWSPMSFPTKDLMLFEEVEDDFAAILGEYGMSRDLFPSTKGATFENQSLAIRATYQNTEQPEADLLMRKLTKEFRLEEQGLELQASYEHVPAMQEDKEKAAREQKTKVEGLILALDKGIITKEQMAAQLGIDYQSKDEAQAKEDRIFEAQMRLRELVGAISAIVEINMAVANGDMDREAGVQTLINSFGYEQSEANAMITTTIKPPEERTGAARPSSSN